MTPITPSATISTPTSATTGGLSAQLSQVDFLRLMTEQLRQQDPTNPADSTQMVVQMAQMSSASGIAGMAKTLDQMAASLSQQTALLTQIEAAGRAASQAKGA